MVITSAHISPIIALIAGVLILLMPRLLNLVVAIYLICIGLIGLGDDAHAGLVEVSDHDLAIDEILRATEGNETDFNHGGCNGRSGRKNATKAAQKT